MKNLFYATALLAGMVMTAASCSSDDKNDDIPTNAIELDYTAENAASWHNYMKNVARLLSKDASDLYTYWAESYDGKEAYSTTFINHHAPFTSASSCVEQIIDGCYDIANEVGTAKIQDPYDLYISGKTTEGLYAVESWYSWHSRTDYSNNILSIRNAYYGSRNGSVAEQSLSKVVAGKDANLDKATIAAIAKAYHAILAIPQPFRNNIVCQESVDAMEACKELADLLNNELKPFFTTNADINSDEVLNPVVKNYVEVVVLPTYKELKEKTIELEQAVTTLANNPSNDNFKAACNKWLEAREPWETSEAFLFGPVADNGLDPNMDSWPLDQEGIANLLKSGKWNALEWSGEFDEDDESISAAQNLRGFHTLEYLLFKNGQARTIQ